MTCHSGSAGMSRLNEEVEPFFRECMPLFPVGLTLDVASGYGRHSLALARLGFRVLAVDRSPEALNALSRAAREEHLSIMPIVTDLANFSIPAQTCQVVMNINFLDRAIVDTLKTALAPGRMLLFDTFLVDQATYGHPRNHAYLLEHYELRSLLAGLELIRYREGLTIYASGKSAWRASALAVRPET
jgi:SAM-dependent methyltransferase